MKPNSTLAALLAAALLALPGSLLAQTEQQRLNEAMQMQRAAFDQDSAGNLDQAIAIYREIAGPRTADRALAAEAQYRLSQALLQKGDLPGATEAMVQLSAGFPDQAERISQLVGRGGGQVAGIALTGRGGRSGGGGAAAGGGGRGARSGGAPAPGVALNAENNSREQLRELERLMVELVAVRNESFQTVYDREFVPGATRSVATAVEGMSWTNPASWLRIADGATTWNLIMPAPNMLIRLGMTRESLPVGEQIRVVLTADASGTPLADGTSLGRVESIVRASDGSVIFDRAAMLTIQAENQAQAAQ
jgi:hypothetical protein